MRYKSFLLNLLLLIVGGGLAFFLASRSILVATVNGEFIPVHPDSFYHATRILQSVVDMGILQFDSKIHLPSGTWVTWPWGFDWLMARLTAFGVLVTGLKPMHVLAYIPPLWGIINVWLIIGISSVINLSFRYRILAVICFLLIPINMQVHILGRVDHHFAELSIVMAFIYFALKWLKYDDKKIFAMLFGAIFGASFIIHNGLFILICPLVFLFFVLWCIGAEMPRNVNSFLGVLLCMVILMALPSEPFRRGFFEYYYLSWFHIYVIICFSIVVKYMVGLSLSLRSFLGLFLIIGIMAIPIIDNCLQGMSFIVGDIDFYRNVSEVKSPFAWSSDMRISWKWVASIYSPLFFLLPVNVGLVIYWVRNRTKSPYWVFILCFSVFGFALMISQIRFHYYGTYLLFLPMIFMVQEVQKSLLRFKVIPVTLLCILLGVLFTFSMDEIFKIKVPSRHYIYSYWASKALEKQCVMTPGVILARHNVGHYLRFHTSCAVIANSMMLTEQDILQVKKVNSLFAKSAEDIVKLHEEINYVFVYWREDQLYEGNNKKENYPQLEGELLINDKVPKGYQLLLEIKDHVNDKVVVVAKAFKIIR